MKYSEYLQLVLEELDTLSITAWICNANRRVYEKNLASLKWQSKLKQTIIDMMQGDTFITAGLCYSNYIGDRRYQTEYRRYILRRLIAQAKLEEK